MHGKDKERKTKGKETRFYPWSGTIFGTNGIATVSLGESLISPLACALNFVQISFRCGHEI